MSKYWNADFVAKSIDKQDMQNADKGFAPDHTAEPRRMKL